MEQGISRQQIIGKLNLSLHGDLTAYQPIISEACTVDPEFLAHLIAWDYVNGQIKDSKIALPIITLASNEFPDELLENSLAHLAMASPRDLLKALKFSIALGAKARRQRSLEKMIRAYLAHKEIIPGKWERLAARHRRPLKALYALTHAPMPEWASAVLFGFKKLEDGSKQSLTVPINGIFSDIANLRSMAPEQVAATIAKWHLSPLVVSGAMAGSKADAADVRMVQAMMGEMSATELVTRARSLEKQGLSRDAGLKETFRKRVAKATKSSKATLKTSVAAEEVEDDGLKAMLQELQERQIQSQKDTGRGIDGNWLVICDRSASQEQAIELGAHISAAITKFVTGRVYLVFCNNDAAPQDVSGKTLDQIWHESRFMRAQGATSYGIGLTWAMANNLELDGIAIVGDGGENTHPVFAAALATYQEMQSKQVPVYLYKTYCPPQHANSPQGNPRQFAALMAQRGLTFTEFDLTSGKVDYYSIPNLVQSMNASRFGVVEKIMAAPLLTLEQVLPQFHTVGK